MENLLTKVVRIVTDMNPTVVMLVYQLGEWEAKFLSQIKEFPVFLFGGWGPYYITCLCLPMMTLFRAIDGTVQLVAPVPACHSDGLSVCLAERIKNVINKSFQVWKQISWDTIVYA